MTKNLTPQQAAEKFVRRTISSTQDMINGVQNVTVAPTQQAIKKKDKLLQNFTASVQSGKWEKGMQRVTLDDWKKSMIEKGAPRVAAGVQASQTKVENFFAELIPYQQQLQADLAKMPDLTLEDSIQRATFAIRRMSDFKRRK